MKDIIKDVLSQYKGKQMNLESVAAIDLLSSEIEKAINGYNKDGLPHHSNVLAEGLYPWHNPHDKRSKENSFVNTESLAIDWTCDICDEDTSKVDYDYIGSGTNHLSCELQKAHEAEECSTQQPMNWIEGMSRERKGTWPGLDKILGGWIYESPDGGETIYKRPFMDYNPENKIKLTKEQWKLEKEK